MSAKWSKGSSGPSGAEHHNLIPEAYGLAVRGRDGESMLEVGDEGVANALMAGDGSSSRMPLIAYRKAQKAHDPEDCERWEETDASDTLAAHGTATAAAVVTPINLRNATRRNGDTGEGTPAAGVGEPGDPSSSVLTGTPPAVAHGWAVRRLTPLECERLQGFPDGWTEGESDSARYRMLGNAVAVPVAEWIGRRLVAHA